MDLQFVHPQVSRCDERLSGEAVGHQDVGLVAKVDSQGQLAGQYSH